MSTALKRLGLAVVFTALAASLYVLPVADWITVLVAWSRQHPVAGPLVYGSFVVIATALFLPGSVAMMIGGFLFGFLPGAVYAAIAIPMGAQAAFELGRYVARPWVQRKMTDSGRMHAIEAALREQSFVIVALTRLSLVIPFNLLNYAYGATSVRATVHLFATSVGMLPAVALYVYLGTLARDLGQILSGEGTPPELGLWILGAGLIMIAALTWIIHRTATRALEKHLLQQKKSESTE